jgi:hypothetical protein
MNKKQAAKAAEALEDILSGKAKGWGAANPNFPNDSYVEPIYSPNSGNGPIDPGFNNPNYPKTPTRKVPKKFKPFPRPNN